MKKENNITRGRQLIKEHKKEFILWGLTLFIGIKIGKNLNLKPKEICKLFDEKGNPVAEYWVV